MARYSPEIAHNVPTAADPIENTSLAEILGAFSYALDLTEGQPAGHSIRACWIGTKIAQTIGLDAAQLRDVYYATLLKDLGCSSNAARVAHLFAGDDRHLKCQFKTIGPDAADFGRFILTEVGANAAPAVREAAVDHLMANAADVLCDVMSTRCTRGASIARQLRFSDDVATAILHLDEHWDGGGLPTGIAGTAIHIGARIALLAQVADVFFTQQGPRAAMVEIAQRRGTWFDPHLVDQFLTIAAAPHFWSPLASPSLETFLFSLEPAQSRVAVDEAYLDDIVSAFGQVIDAKSPYTSGHSERVGLFTDLIAQRMGI
ncbi:MAG: HD-GYP domain-containing protein, partial [Sphingopyxis sp.]